MRFRCACRRLPPARTLVLSLVAVLAAGVAAPNAAAGAQDQARYEAAGSFQLPAADQAEGPEAPVALAVGADGSVRVLDEEGALFVFGSAGGFSGRISGPWDGKLASVAVDSAGWTYLLHEDAGRVFVVSPEGDPTRSWGRSGDQEGRMDDPVDLAVGPSRFVYVLDRGHGAVQVFGADGTYLRSVPLPEDFGDPVSLAVARNGRILVGLKGDDGAVVSLARFPRHGWASDGEGEAADRAGRGVLWTQQPVGLAVTSRGLLVAADGRSRRLFASRLRDGEGGSASSRYLYGGKGSGRGSFRRIEGVALASANQVLVLDSELRKIERIRLPEDADAELLPRFRFPIRPSRIRYQVEADLLEIESRGAGEAREVLFVDRTPAGGLKLTGGTRERFRTPTGQRFWQYRRDPAAFELDLALSEVERIGDAAVGDSVAVVTDPEEGRFIVFSLDDGSRLGSVGEGFEDERELEDPTGVEVLADGRIAVCDPENDRVSVFAPDLATMERQFTVPRADGVVERRGGLIVWGEEGRTVVRIELSSGSVEPVPPSLVPRPVAHVDVDQGGNLISLHAETGRIAVSQPSVGGVLVEMGREDEVEHPERVLVDPEGNLYAVDEHLEESVVFRWDVRVPGPGSPRVTYTLAAADVAWEGGPAHLISGYRIEGSADRDGDYRSLSVVDSAGLRVDSAGLGDAIPRYIRTVPELVTGGDGPVSEPVPLHHLAAFAARARGDHATALEAAREALAVLDEGVVEGGGDGVRGELLWTGLRSAFRLSEYDEAVALGDRLRGAVAGERRAEYHALMGRSHLEMGSAKRASRQLLELLAAGPDPELVADSAVLSASFDVARRLAADAGGDAAAGAGFLEAYRSDLPPGTSELRRLYADSLQVYRNRRVLGEGLELWRDLRYSEAIDFFRGLLQRNERTGELTIEQRVLCNQFVAAAQKALGRQEEARETFRWIFELEPTFDLREAGPRLEGLYGVSLYSGESVRSFFMEVQSQERGAAAGAGESQGSPNP